MVKTSPATESVDPAIAPDAPITPDAWTLGCDFQTATTALDRLRVLGDAGLKHLLLSPPNSNPYALGWDGRDRYDYHEYELLMARILDAYPEMTFTLRFGSLHGTPNYWAVDHQDQLAVYHLGEKMQQASLGSVTWREDSSEAARRFAAHFSSGQWQERVTGLMPYSTGVYWRGVGESPVNIPPHEVPQRVHDPVEGDFSQPMRSAFRGFLREKYGSDEALQDAWRATHVTLEMAELPGRIEVRSPTPAVRDYFDCYNRLNAELALSWSAAMKEAAPDKTVTLPHGYVFGWPNQSLSPQGSGHNHPEMLLDSDAVDRLYAPPAQSVEHRNPLSQHAVDSVHLHGKTHVHAIELMNLVTMQVEDQLAELTLHVGYAAVKGSDVAMSEVREGRGSMRDDSEVVLMLPYHDSQLAERAKFLRQWHAKQLTQKAESVAEVAVFIDPRGSHCRARETRFGNTFIEQFRNKTMSRCGVPFDEYHLADFEEVCDRYAAWVFIDTPEFSDAQWARIKAAPSQCFFASVNRSQVTAESFAAFLDGVGIHRWAAVGTPFFANDRVIAVALPDAGDHTIHLPQLSKVSDAITGQVLAESAAEITFSAESAGQVVLLEYEPDA